MSTYESFSARTALAVSGGSTELVDLLQGDSLWSTVYGKVEIFSVHAILVKYDRFEKNDIFRKICFKKLYCGLTSYNFATVARLAMKFFIDLYRVYIFVLGKFQPAKVNILVCPIL